MFYIEDQFELWKRNETDGSLFVDSVLTFITRASTADY